MNNMDLPLYEQVGFNYSLAVLELLKVMTYDNIAFSIGYKNRSSVSAILCGSTPGHIQGEALWALYIETFGHKPPLDVHINKRLM